MTETGFARTMKKVLAVALALGLAFTSLGCTAGENDSSASERADLVVYLLEGRDTATQGIANVESSLRQIAATFEDAEGLSVEVRVGIPADSGVTADDAQRALNASLLARRRPRCHRTGWSAPRPHGPTRDAAQSRRRSRPPSRQRLVLREHSFRSGRCLGLCRAHLGSRSPSSKEARTCWIASRLSAIW